MLIGHDATSTQIRCRKRNYLQHLAQSDNACVVFPCLVQVRAYHALPIHRIHEPACIENQSTAASTSIHTVLNHHPWIRHTSKPFSNIMNPTAEIHLNWCTRKDFTPWIQIESLTVIKSLIKIRNEFGNFDYWILNSSYPQGEAKVDTKIFPDCKILTASVISCLSLPRDCCLIRR